MNRKIYVTLLLLISSIWGYAQDGLPIYLDYFANNTYLLHPASAGAAPYPKLRLTARQQWFDSEDAPNLQTVSFSTRLGERSGIGAIFYNDKNGYHSQVGGYLTYAHHIMFSRRSDADLNQLSFGLSAGLVQSKLDETNFDPNDFDPIIAGIIQSSSYFNADAGVSYYFLGFSGHFTVKNIIFQSRRLYTEDFEPKNQRTYNIAATYFITSQGPWAYEPSFLFQWKERTGEQSIDVNFKAYREMEFGRLWGGISYRRSLDGAEYLDGTEIKNQKLQYITPVLGVNFNKFVFAYTYSLQRGSIRFENGGFHQITLGYNIIGGKINRWSQDMRYNGMLRPDTNFRN